MSSQALRRGYRDLQHRSEAHEELIELLRNLPDQEAQYVLHRLRSGSGVKAILNQVKAGDLLLQLAVSPETRFRYEFPYRSEMPQDVVIDNPYLDSLIYEASSLYSPAQQPKPSESTGTSRIPGLRSVEYGSLYLKPFHAAQVVEPRLSNARPSLWTTICDDDVLMRDLLGVFFRCEYHFTAAFQKDYFLEDMIAQREDFCSPLLVNVTLAYSCVQYSHISQSGRPSDPVLLRPATTGSRTVPNIGTPKRSCIASLPRPNGSGNSRLPSHALLRYKLASSSMLSITFVD